MKTAETITDAEIRALWKRNVGITGRTLAIALSEPFPWGEYPTAEETRKARARCAEIANRIGPGYSPRVERALAAVDGWTVQDFIDLVIAAADQAGASDVDQRRIAEILNVRRAVSK